MVGNEYPLSYRQCELGIATNVGGQFILFFKNKISALHACLPACVYSRGSNMHALSHACQKQVLLR